MSFTIEDNETLFICGFKNCNSLYREKHDCSKKPCEIGVNPPKTDIEWQDYCKKRCSFFKANNNACLYCNDWIITKKVIMEGENPEK